MNTLLGLSLQCFLLIHFARGGGESLPGTFKSNTATFCSCKKSCQARQLSHLSSVTSPTSFYFDSSLGYCVQLPSACEVDSKCAFVARNMCELKCESSSEDSEKQSRKKESGGHISNSKEQVGKAEVPDQFRHESGHGRGVRWDMVVGGTCIMVVLVATLSVVGVVTYNYRNKKKKRIRSQYIRNVMEMYDSTSDSCVSEGEESSPLGGREEPFIRL